MTDDHFNPLAILELTEWINLEDAQGSAFPDTPAKLRDLTSGDSSAITISLNHLYSALLNDGVVYSATVPAFRYIAALLSDPLSRTALAPPWEAGTFPLRGKLLAWLGNVAFDVSVGQERRIREWGRFSPSQQFPNFIGIRNLYLEAFPGIALYLDDTDSRVAEAALVAAVLFLEFPALAVYRGKIAPLVKNFLTQSSNEWHRSLASEAWNAWGGAYGSVEICTPSLDEHADDPQERPWPFDDPPF